LPFVLSSAVLNLKEIVHVFLKQHCICKWTKLCMYWYKTILNHCEAPKKTCVITHVLF